MTDGHARPPGETAAPTASTASTAGETAATTASRRPGGWGSFVTGALALLMPVFAVLGLGSQMGLRTAEERLEWLRTVPEHRALANLTEEPAGATVLLYGRLASDAPEPSPASAAGDASLLIYRELPVRAPGRRFSEDLPQVFPVVALELDDGRVRVLPSQEGERPLHDAPHVLEDPAGEWRREGFRAGDRVSIQGRWLPAGVDGASAATLREATGLSGQSKAEMSAELDSAWRRVSIFGWGCLALTFAGLVSLLWRWRVARRSPSDAR